jgi:hypothetical protein
MVSTLLEVPFFFPQDEKGPYDVISNIASKIQLGSLYFFVFEIKKLEGRFRADTYEQALKAVKITKIQELVVLAIFILVVTPAELGLLI